MHVYCIYNQNFSIFELETNTSACFQVVTKTLFLGIKGEHWMETIFCEGIIIYLAIIFFRKQDLVSKFSRSKRNVQPIHENSGYVLI